MRYGDRDFEGLVVEPGTAWRMMKRGVLVVMAACFVVLAWMIVEPTEKEPAMQEPKLSEINAQNIEVLRKAVEQEIGKQITFMADGSRLVVIDNE